MKTFQVWHEVRKQNDAQGTFDWDAPMQNDTIEVGDEVTYTPHNQKREEPVTGYVAEEIKGSGDDKGYNLLVTKDIEEDLGYSQSKRATRTETLNVRVWLSRGTIVKTGREADWKHPAPTPKAKYSAPTDDRKPYRNAGDLASQYKWQGLDRQGAWKQFVVDTILQPQYRSEQVNAKEFFAMFDES